MVRDINFKFVLPSITINFDKKPSLKSIRPKLAILDSISKKLQKLTKVAISQNPIFPKCHSPKSLLLHYCSMNFSEAFRINVNMDFAHTNHGRFLIKASQKMLAQIFFEGLNKIKSAMISIAKSIFTLILNVSDKFFKKCRRSRLFGE